MGETSGMSTFISSLNTGLSGTALWGAIADIAPLVITVTLFALGLYFVRKVTKRTGRGKGGM